jgi:hypothetical protein
MENHYSDTPPTPFQTQLVDKSEVGISGEGKVVIATPDPNYVYPMLVMAESSLNSTFSTCRNPENVEIKYARKDINENNSLSASEKEEALKETIYLPDLITGQDSFEVIERKVLASKNSNKQQDDEEVKSFELYVEYSYKQSSQDAQFQNCLEEGTYRQVMGRPPSASTFQQVYKKITDQSKKKKTNKNKRLYYITSTNDPEIQEYSNSLSFETNNLSKALKAAKVELAIQNLNSWKQRSVGLNFYFPHLRPGDYLHFEDLPEDIKWRIKSVSYTIEFNGFVDGIPFLTCDGTSVDLGIYEEDPLQLSSKKETSSDGNLEVEAWFRGERTVGRLDTPTSATRRARYNDPFVGTDIAPEV